MSISDQRRWFVTSPQYTFEGNQHQDVVVVEAISTRQAAAVGIKTMRNLKKQWPTVAAQAGISLTATLKISPVDEDDIATKMATHRLPRKGKAVKDSAQAR